jgi:hypothetical protein
MALGGKGRRHGQKETRSRVCYRGEIPLEPRRRLLVEHLDGAIEGWAAHALALVVALVALGDDDRPHLPRHQGPGVVGSETMMTVYT